MSEKPISPLRQRMLEDMNMRRFVPDTQRDGANQRFESQKVPVAVDGIRPILCHPSIFHCYSQFAIGHALRK